MRIAYCQERQQLHGAVEVFQADSGRGHIQWLDY